MDLTTAYTDSWSGQPGSAEWVGERRPTNEQWVLIAAVWLLATWSAEQRRDWEFTLVTGRVKARQDQQWPHPPPLAEIADAGDLPVVTGATVLTSRVTPGPGRPYEPVRTDQEVAAEIVSLITSVVALPDQRGQALVGFLANHLAGPYSDVLRLTSDAEPLESLHLLHRDTFGSTLRVSLLPAPQVRQPLVHTSGGVDAAHQTRIACIMTLLSDMLWVNNNNPVAFRLRIGRLDQRDGSHVAATPWWADYREVADEHDEEELHPISSTDLRAGLRNLVRLFLSELHDGEWSGIEEFPELPTDHLAPYLIDDLVDAVLARMGNDLRIAHTGFLPVTWPPDDEEYDNLQTHVLLGAGDEVAVLEVDLSC